MALSTFAGVWTFLSWRRYEYPDSGVAIVLYPLIGLGLAVAIVVLTYRGDHRWAALTGAALVVGTVASVGVVGTGTMASGIVEVCAKSGYDVVFRARGDDKVAAVQLGDGVFKSADTWQDDAAFARQARDAHQSAQGVVDLPGVLGGGALEATRDDCGSCLSGRD